jgi:hypothetical protein
VSWRSTAGNPVATAALSEGFCPDDHTPLSPCLLNSCPDLHGYCGSCGLWWILTREEMT